MIDASIFKPTASTAQPSSEEPVPHVVAWNLTRLCNLRCAHCYLNAGPDASTTGELNTRECLRIADEILALNPAPMFILSGGEPLLRDDLETIAAHASSQGATVVVGTNGVLLDDSRIASLLKAGVSGVAISVDSLTERYHDRFRQGDGALVNTLRAVENLRRADLDFVIQTTLTRGNRDELESIAAWAADAGAVSFNVYMVVQTGRASHMSALDYAAGEHAIEALVDLHERYLGTMMVRAKCRPPIHADPSPAQPQLTRASLCKSMPLRNTLLSCVA